MGGKSEKLLLQILTFERPMRSRFENLHDEFRERCGGEMLFRCLLCEQGVSEGFP